MKTPLKLDFHTHSILSHDGGIDELQYKQVLDAHILDCLSITDHGTIEYAEFCKKKLGESIIVGEEITTKQGHVIGLFLTKQIDSGFEISATIEAIKSQNGLVYIPHPYDVARHGIGEKNLLTELGSIDIIEIFNARVLFRNQNNKALEFSKKHNLARGVGSDAHSAGALGTNYVQIEAMPTLKNLAEALKIAQYSIQYASLGNYFDPKLNTIKKLLKL